MWRLRDSELENSRILCTQKACEILQFLPDRLGSRRRGSGLGPFGIAAKLGPQPEPIHVTARREPTD